MKNEMKAASNEGQSILNSNREAVKNRLQDSPVLTIHTKESSKINQNIYETSCMLNKAAMKAVFKGQTEECSLNFGNRKRFHVEHKEGEVLFAGIRDEVCITNTKDEIRGGTKASRFKVSSESGLIEGDYLGGMIFYMHEGLGKMNENTVYHFRLLPYANTLKSGRILGGWELHLKHTEPAEGVELALEIANSQKQSSNKENHSNKKE